MMRTEEAREGRERACRGRRCTHNPGCWGFSRPVLGSDRLARVCAVQTVLLAGVDALRARPVRGERHSFRRVVGESKTRSAP